MLNKEKPSKSEPERRSILNNFHVVPAGLEVSLEAQFELALPHLNYIKQ
jgi:hypothetical protein